jgi:hypothetical protein
MAFLDAGGTVTGSGVLTGSASLAQLLSGNLTGSGVLSIPGLEASGTVFGSSTVIGDALRTIGVSGVIQGQGTLFLSGVPDTVYGTSSLTGELVSEVIPPPLSQPTELKTFRWGEFFQPEDLTLYLRDSSGPVMPNSVSYTLYWLRNGVPFQAGPADRTPVRGVLGEFYATGKVGEFGQPGDWLIRWHYQRNFFSPLQEVEFRFVIQDALAAADPRDVTVRVQKYGWD